MTEKKLEEMTITCEGKDIPFREYVRDLGGSGTMYDDKDFRNIFKNWPVADFAYIDDYIVPMAAQVIIDASELDRELYAEIMQVVQKAYKQLRPHNPNLTLIK